MLLALWKPNCYFNCYRQTMEQAAEERERREGSAWPETQTQHRCSNTLKSLGAKCQSPAPISKPARIAPRHVGEQHLLSMSCPWVKQREWPWLLAGKRCVGFRKTGDKEEQGREEGAEWKSQWEHLLCLRSIRSSPSQATMELPLLPPLCHSSRPCHHPTATASPGTEH